MVSLKYYNGIKHAQDHRVPRGPGATPDIDYETPPAKGLRALMARASGMVVRPALWFFRNFWPVPKVLGIVVVTRFKHVKEVLANTETFEVPFALEMTELGGVNSILGMEDAEHCQLREAIWRVMPRDSTADQERVRKDTAEIAEALIRNAGGRLDVINDLITRTATESCIRYFGLVVDDPHTFADWTMAVSYQLFADPYGLKETRRRGLYASARLQDVVAASLAAGRERAAKGVAGDTLIDRFLRAQEDLLQAEVAAGRAARTFLTDKLITATLIGLMTGYIPTNTLAAGKMLEALLRRPNAWQKAQRVARGGDTPETRARLQRILMEAGRLNPALFPGQFRYARKDGVIAPGSFWQRIVPKGSVIMVATSSALVDWRAFAWPYCFKPNRQQHDDLMFGFGPHECMGLNLAKVQITEVFLKLLPLDNLRPAPGAAGKMRMAGAFPRQLDMTFAPPAGAPPPGQSMVVVCAPIKPGVDERRLKAEVDALGNPAQPNTPMWRALKASGRIHFASVSVLDLGEPDQPSHYLLAEINADGAPDEAMIAFAAATQRWLEPIFDCAVDGPAGLLETLRRYNLASHAKPYSATHLNFNGTPEFAVADIDKQERLARFTRRALDFYQRRHLGFDSRPIAGLRFVRNLIRGEVPPLPPNATAGEVEDHWRMQRFAKVGKARFGDYLVQPGRRRLKLTEWVDISLNEGRRRAVLSKDALPAWILLGALWLVMSAGVFLSLRWHVWAGVELVFAYDRWGDPLAVLPNPDLFIKWPALLWRAFLSLAIGLLAEALLVALVVARVVSTLRAKEKADVPDTRYPSLKHIEECTSNENAPGFAQNHFIATPILKRGLFRRLTMAAALWGIYALIVHGFRPGLVLNMGTIHYAKWFRVPKSRRLVFLANYDGSWESYLEDFIMKAHTGQTAAWSNCEGFPPTEGLGGKGAQDGDRFKRWVRRQQAPTGFWFSRFPTLTTDRMRNNALIHHGLARAHSDSAARAWMACLGSFQRPQDSIEAEQVQSLVFTGFGTFKHALFAQVSLPEAPERRAEWLRRLIHPAPATLAGFATGAVPVQNDLSITFGDAPGDLRQSRIDLQDGEKHRVRSATAVAFSARGLTRLGLPPGDDGDGLATFPAPFTQGMGRRSRILGDLGDNSPERWRWVDTGHGTHWSARRSDGVLVLYADSDAACRNLLDEHRAVLGDEAFFGIVQTQPVPEPERHHDEHNRSPQGWEHKSCSAAHEDARTGGEKHPKIPREHFGFRDGFSQPVIRGTQRFVKGEARQDVLEPGEFILGYPSNQGYFPPSPVVSAEVDPANLLPTVQSENPAQFPAFSEAAQGLAFHDFGRNGTYLVLRQLEQKVKEFDAFTEAAAKRLTERYPGLDRAVGLKISDVKIGKEWVAAKMIGRWRDGTSLIDRPHKPPNDDKPAGDNRFAYGENDPQGLRCPLGAHVRRANPRDSFLPGDADGRAIVNRHRLMRRGRSYDAVIDGKHEQGLVFACLCADLERQYEFVQQTWINSPSFHGLDGEADPMLRGEAEGHKFTIPTPGGAVVLKRMESFVNVKAGGYYFMPSRAALRYLADRSERLAHAMHEVRSPHPPPEPPREPRDDAPRGCPFADAPKAEV